MSRMETTTNIPVEKLEGINNYVNWKFAMQMLLTLDGMWKCIDGTNTDDTLDSRALARICLAIKPTLYQYVRDAKTAKEAWQKLASTFEPKGLYRKVLLLRQLHKVEYKQYSGMSEYIEAVMRLVQQLADIGKIIEDDEVAEILLSGLSQEFDNLVSGLETACLTSKLTSELVRTRLLQEEHRRNGEEGSTAFYVNKKKKNPLFCSFCKRTGHTVKKCFKKKREDQKGPHSMFASANAASSQDSQDFILDSGSTSHMTSDRDLFAETAGTTAGRHAW